jgi:membrane peptidoglycan carboxypeptidase
MAVAKSLNTVAVRVMDDYGIDNSIKFLDEKFDIDFEDEASSDMLDAEADEFAEFDLDYPEID